MGYNLIIRSDIIEKTKVYGCYDTYREAKRKADMIFGREVVIHQCQQKMRVDYCLILDDVQLINAKIK